MSYRFVNGRYLLAVVVVIIGVIIGMVLNTTTANSPIADLGEARDLPEPETLDEPEEPAQARVYPLPVLKKAEPSLDELVVEYQLQREQSRSSQLELLQAVASDPEGSPEVKIEAQRRILELASLNELEVNLTGLLRSEGFVNPIVVASEYGVTVSVGGPALTQNDAARIGSLIARMSGIDQTKVVIMER